MERRPVVTGSLRRAVVALALAGMLPATWLATIPAASAVVFVVNRFGDLSDLNPGDGLCDTEPQNGRQCTLRAAIEEANATAGADTVNFNIGGTAQVKTLIPVSPYPAITEAVTIDGYTQPGATPNTLATGNDAVLKIQLNGTNAGVEVHGLAIDADDSTVRGLLINRFGGSGIRITGSANVVEGNFIGTNSGGDLGNGGFGVSVVGGTTNVIGGATPAARNLISANDGAGVHIQGEAADGNVVQGNFIGTNKGGTAALPNGQGVKVSSADGTLIGGAQPGAGNVISGNAFDGVDVFELFTEGTIVQGNRIGTNAAGTVAVPNGSNGVDIFNAPGAVIGGGEPGAGNVISGNGGSGVRISDEEATGITVQGNLIGTNAAGTAVLGNGAGVVLESGAVGNLVGGSDPGERNVISGNGADGIRVFDSNANQISGNLIGTNAAGTADLGNSGHGVSLVSSDLNSIVEAGAAGPNVISGNGADGVSISFSHHNNIEGNFIGTNAAGNADVGNSDDGISVTGGSGNDIGDASVGNLISGNDGAGVEISGAGSRFNTVLGNVIGLRANANGRLGNSGPGVTILDGADQNNVGGSATGQGNVISSNSVGVEILEPGAALGNTVRGNMIGTNLAGTAARGNLDEGVFLGAPNTLVGGFTAGARNVISGNDGPGVRIQGALATGNHVEGNYIGTTVTGDAALGNGGAGVRVQADDNFVGGSTGGRGNVISANGGDGVSLANASGTLVQGNRIGTKADGTGDLGNALEGVGISSSPGTTIGGPGAASNLIAGNDARGITNFGGESVDTLIKGNVIRGNAFAGVRATNGDGTIEGNVIFSNGGDGVEVFSPSSFLIQGNQIFANAALGIDLVGSPENAAGVTSNDTDDPDDGANDLQNFPVLTSAVRDTSTGVTTITGSLNSTPSTQFRILFYLALADPSNHGEGQFPIGSRDITTNAGGDRGFSFASTALAPGQVVTATATKIATGDTSEFALNRPVTVVP